MQYIEKSPKDQERIKEIFIKRKELEIKMQEAKDKIRMAEKEYYALFDENQLIESELDEIWQKYRHDPYGDRLGAALKYAKGNRTKDEREKKESP